MSGPEEIARMGQLTERLEELARALEAAGAPAEASGRLLELASVATLKAVALAEAHRPPEPRALGSVEILAAVPAERPRRLRAA